MERLTPLFVQERIKQVLETRIGVNPSLLNDSGPDTFIFREGLGLDSVEALDLAGAIEDEFSITVEADDFNESTFRTIGTLSSYVVQKAEARPSSPGGRGTP